MKIHSLACFAPLAASPVVAYLSRQPPPTNHQLGFHRGIFPSSRRGYRSSTPALFASTTTTTTPSQSHEESTPFFAKSQLDPSPPEIPPPDEFDDPVDLSVVVSWVSYCWVAIVVLACYLYVIFILICSFFVTLLPHN